MKRGIAIGSWLGLMSLWLVVPVVAQQARTSTDAGPPIIHITDQLSHTPEARAALAAFHEAKAQGLLPVASKTSANYSIGSITAFNVIDKLLTSPTWIPLDFELKAESDIARIWVQVDELSNGNVNDATIADLRMALLEETPSGSINTSQGIIVNDNQIFGDPPNVDGDGKVDVLLYDINEGSSDCCIMGYVTPQDLNLNAPDGQGNKADVLHLDSNEGISGSNFNLLGTAAHEYQHLIHFNYDRNEEAFLNEGLSEWAETMNGYPSRSVLYLTNPFEYSQPLFTWRGADPISTLVLDYQRAGLFITYIAEQFSPEIAGSITQQSIAGAEGLANALVPTGTSLADVITDFHTANLFNDRNLDTRFGYTTTHYQQLRARLSAPLAAPEDTENDPTEIAINSGAVNYLTWNNVEDFSLFLDVVAPAVIAERQRQRLRIRFILEQDNVVVDVRDELPQELPYFFEGFYTRIIAAVIHTEPASTGNITYAYQASTGGSAPSNVVERSYDDGTTDAIFFSPPAGANGAVGTRFTVPVPVHATLASVSLSPFYLNQMDGSTLSSDAPRDLTLKVWEADFQGQPIRELFSLDVEDPRPFHRVASDGEIERVSLNFFTVDLSEHAATLSGLPSSIVVGYTEAGTDANFMVVGASNYTDADVSVVGNLEDETWTPLWQHEVTGEDASFLQNRVVPIRAEFRIGTAVVSTEAAAELPTQITLDQNYPNPFNPATTISYSLAEATNVQLHVYDALGRRVATLAEGFAAAGTYTATLDASGWSSGLYLYVLQAADQQQMRKMVLLK